MYKEQYREYAYGVKGEQTLSGPQLLVLWPKLLQTGRMGVPHVEEVQWSMTHCLTDSVVCVRALDSQTESFC